MCPVQEVPYALDDGIIYTNMGQVGKLLLWADGHQGLTVRSGGGREEGVKLLKN